MYVLYPINVTDNWRVIDNRRGMSCPPYRIASDLMPEKEHPITLSIKAPF
jgi:hypothetical protein